MPFKQGQFRRNWIAFDFCQLQYVWHIQKGNTRYLPTAMLPNLLWPRMFGKVNFSWPSFVWLVATVIQTNSGR